MSISNVFFTKQGKILQAKCMLGKTLNFKKIVLGDGELQGKIAQELPEVISPKMNVPITKLIKLDDGKVKIGGKFNNTGLSTGFYYRELGLIAIDPDTNNEVLYCYGNAGVLAEYVSGEGTEIIEKQIDIIALVGNEADVRATIEDSLLGVSPEDLEEHNDDENSHQPLRVWITNLLANLTLPWSKITAKPDAYPPTAHEHNAVTTSANGFMSATDKVKLNGIAVSANNYVHPGNGTNPHGTTKTDVGLGSVQNYPVASLADAKAGVSNVMYMTPYLVKEACKMYGGDYMGKVLSMVSTETLFSLTVNNNIPEATIFSVSGSGIASIKLLEVINALSTKGYLTINSAEFVVDGVVVGTFYSSGTSYSQFLLSNTFKVRSGVRDSIQPQLDDFIVPFESSFKIVVKSPVYVLSSPGTDGGEASIIVKAAIYKNR